MLNSYLSNRKRYIEVESQNTDYLKIKCGGPQSSIMGTLLFLISVNDLSLSSRSLEKVMFADDKNLFFSQKDIKYLFGTVNFELNMV